MASNNNRLISLNVRGLCNFRKRKAVFKWLDNARYDIIFLQETHSSPKLEQIWNREWLGPMFFAHGTTNSRGCCILIRDSVDFKPIHVRADSNGRFLTVQCMINGDSRTLVNVYAPNVESDQVTFIKNLDEILVNCGISNLNDIVMAGDWNVVRDMDLDKSGGNYFVKKRSIESIDELIVKYNLNDTWRIKHPCTRRYSWRQSNPLIQCRLDYFLISDSLFDQVVDTDIIPSIRSDHSAITLEFQNIPISKKGPNIWKFNVNLLEDTHYTKEMKSNLKSWINKYDIEDKQLKWELIKYEIRKYSIAFSKKKRHETSKRKLELEQQLCHLERNLSNHNNVCKYNDVKQELKKMDDEKIKGHIIRSKVQWHEEGERSTKYFLGLEKNRAIKKHMQKLRLKDGKFTTDPNIILQTASDFYKQLYTSKASNDNSDFGYGFMHTKILKEEDKDSCDGDITIKECTDVIHSFKKNKTPGNDGISAEFYQYFWSDLNTCMIDSFNFAYNKGELSPSQKQAIITLVDKGKDREFIENWRPISILNVDYKMASKVLANRLSEKIPDLVGLYQTGFVKGRYMSDTVRTLYDVIEYCKLTNTSGLILTIDFEKAFDSLEWDFLFKTLQNMNFGESFIRWIKLFYYNIESCISNNGITSTYFKIERGVRQGDPLSPYLFILCAEVMSQLIIRNHNIQGITMNTTEFKILQYADDTTAILKDENSARVFLSEITKFGKFSGLNINTSKSEAIWLGDRPPLFKLPNSIKWCKDPVKILGVYVGWDLKAAWEISLEKKITGLKRILNSWKTRQLTLNGKVIIIKSLAISQIIYLMGLLPFPDDVIKDIECAIYNFLWSSKTHKVKKSVIIQEYKDGGCKMIDIRSQIITQKLKWVKLYLNCHDGLWRSSMEGLINVKNLGVFLRSNFDLNTEWTKSIFYSDVLNALHKLNIVDQYNTKDNLINQFMFYDKRVKIGQKPVYDNELFQAGLWRFCDLFQSDGTIVPFSNWESRGVSKGKFIIWKGVLSIVQKLELEINTMNSSKNIPNKTVLLPTGDIIDLQYSNSKEIYSKIVKLRKVKPTSLISYVEQYDLSEKEIDNMFLLPRICTDDMLLKEFQYKILHKYLATNSLLYKMKKVESNRCTFCGLYVESITHIFYDCIESKNVWFMIQSVLVNIDCTVRKLTCKDVVLGFRLENMSSNNMFINNVILQGKFYLWKCRSAAIKPSYVKFKEYIQYRSSIDKNLDLLCNNM